LNIIAKIGIAAGAVLVVGTGVAATLLPDATLRALPGPVGGAAVGFKHGVHESLEESLYGIKEFWWDLSEGKLFDSSPRTVVELPKTLRDQFGKRPPSTRPALKEEAGAEQPAPVMRAEPAPMAEAKPEPAPAPAAAEAHAEPKPMPAAGHETTERAAETKPAMEPAPQQAKPMAAEAEHKTAEMAHAPAPPPPPPPPSPEPKPKMAEAPKPAPQPAPQPAPKPEPKPAVQPAPAPAPAPQQASAPNMATDTDGSMAHKEGLKYYKGDGVGKDFRKAAEWFEKAAAKGHAGAQYNLGILSYLGQGGPQDFATAAKWFNRAAEAGHAAAQYNLGFMYYEGKGVKKDDLQAYTWIDRAANQGHKKAMTARDALAKALPREIFQSR